MSRILLRKTTSVRFSVTLTQLERRPRGGTSAPKRGPRQTQRRGTTPWHARCPRRRSLAACARLSRRCVRRSALLALRKRYSSARRVDREALTPHPALGAQFVRGHMFSCGRTRPTTICQAPVGLRRDAKGDKPCRGTSSSSSCWIRRVSDVHGTRGDRTVRAPRLRSHCSCRPHLSACTESRLR